MERCRDCDGPITGEAEFRDIETVPVRSPFQEFLAGVLVPGLGLTRRQRVPLCAACAAARDTEEHKKSRGGRGFVIAIFLGFLLITILSVVYILRLG
jgi:hypothetical protein